MTPKTCARCKGRVGDSGFDILATGKKETYLLAVICEKCFSSGARVTLQLINHLPVKKNRNVKKSV